MDVLDLEPDRYLLELPNQCSAHAQLFSMNGSVRSWAREGLEPRSAGDGLADPGCYYHAMNNADLLPTVLSHPPCPVFPDHADVHWPGHWAQELKQLKDSQRCSSCVLIKLPLYVAKICKPPIYFIWGLCTPGRRRPYRFPRTCRIRS